MGLRKTTGDRRGQKPRNCVVSTICEAQELSRRMLDIDHCPSQNTDTGQADS